MNINYCSESPLYCRFNAYTFSLMLVFIISIGFSSINAFAGINPGDILVADDSAGTDFRGVLFKIDPNTGQRTVISDFGDPTQGPLGEEPRDLAQEPDGSICVIDPAVGTNGDGLLFRVNPRNGQRTIISDFGDPVQGPIGAAPQRVALFTNGNLYVTDPVAPNGSGGLFRVDKLSGDRTLVSDLSNAAQGPIASDAYDVAEGPVDNIYLLTLDGGVDDNGFVFRVDPDTGFRIVISEMGDVAQGPVGSGRWFAVSPDGGVIYVLSNDVSPETVLSVDPVNGDRQIITNFTDAGQGPTDGNIQGIEVDNDGQILVNATQSDLLLSIDPVTGIRTVISDYSDPSQGPLGAFGVGIIIAQEIVIADIPTLNQWGLIAMAGILGIVGFMVIRRRKVTA